MQKTVVQAVKGEGNAPRVGYARIEAKYPELVKQAKRFVDEMTGDGEFASAGQNALAVENMVIGWIYGQVWFEDMEGEVRRKYPRENVLLVIRDFALQAATDATTGNRRFSNGEVR